MSEPGADVVSWSPEHPGVRSSAHIPQNPESSALSRRINNNRTSCSALHSNAWLMGSCEAAGRLAADLAWSHQTGSEQPGSGFSSGLSIYCSATNSE